jgi:hypothetical protein
MMGRPFFEVGEATKYKGLFKAGNVKNSSLRGFRACQKA